MENVWKSVDFLHVWNMFGKHGKPQNRILVVLISYSRRKSKPEAIQSSGRVVYRNFRHLMFLNVFFSSNV